MSKILAVDDEPFNITLIKDFLELHGLAVDTASNADEALAMLPGHEYDLFVLDRMMPGMDGLELLKRLKADPRTAPVPVVMQTAADSAEQVREGLEAGAYYYLTKPYSPSSLLTIVRAALRDYEERRKLLETGANLRGAMDMARLCDFEFASIDEARRLASALASLCPDPNSATLGLVELLVNAVEHGNLGISYDEKRQLRIDDRWDEEVARRQTDPALGARRVHVRYERAGEELRFTIRDEGAGFDWTGYLEFDPGRALDPNGRGIAMSRLMSFSALEYRGKGNEVVASVRR